MSEQLVLLTGASGMIGFKTLLTLLEYGYNVRLALRSEQSIEKVLGLPAMAKYKNKVQTVVVPDMTVEGAYDEAVKGVPLIVHVASPLAGNTPGKDFAAEIVLPAIKGTLGMLESAVKAGVARRVVITASVASYAPVETPPEGLYHDQFSAYVASKALSYRSTQKFVEERKPTFTVINIMPSFVLGRDETVTDPAGIAKGTNGLLMGPLLGHAIQQPMSGETVHVADVAKIHALALDPKIEGNRDFIASADNKGVAWGDSFDIVKRRYPDEYANGLFKFDNVPRTVTTHSKYDTTNTRETFNLNFQDFESQVISVVGHYLELVH